MRIAGHHPLPADWPNAYLFTHCEDLKTKIKLALKALIRPLEALKAL